MSIEKINEDRTNKTTTEHRRNAPSSRFPRPDKDSILVAAIGGVGQIGMNWTLYGHDGKWILVDAGSAFAPKGTDGIEAIYPDPASLRRILPDLVALVVTHAHEDHIGAIHRLWPKMRAPIYATPFAKKILSDRFAEQDVRVPIRTFAPGDTLSVGPFSIETVPVCHSVPECVGLALSTAAGTVYHSGDWKIDPDPVVGHRTDMDRLVDIGRRGVLAVVGDSTNADRRGSITSESTVGEGMKAVFASTKGTVVVSCFASNVARMASVARAAAASGRKVLLMGRSMLRNEEAARSLGMLNGVPEFVRDASTLRGLERDKVAILCTGTQGEERAALGRMAAGDDDRLPPIGLGDVIVHSARAIPGNEEEIDAVLSKFEARGATVLRGRYGEHSLHVTGHATADEIGMLYDALRPSYVIPVHGESVHLEAHAEIAAAAGVRATAIIEEGDVVRVSRRKVEVVAKVRIGLQAALTPSGRSREEKKVQWKGEETVAYASKRAQVIRECEERRREERAERMRTEKPRERKSDDECKKQGGSPRRRGRGRGAPAAGRTGSRRTDGREQRAIGSGS